MAKQLMFEDHARSKLLRGVDKLADAVAVTMGPTAFIMASFLNLPYSEVALAAALPSMLYYLGLFMQIDAYAAKYGMQGLPESEPWPEHPRLGALRGLRSAGSRHRSWIVAFREALDD